MTYRDLKIKVHSVVYGHGEEQSAAATLYHRVFFCLVVAHITATIISTFEGLPHAVHNIIHVIEVAAVLTFTLEYILCFWTAPLAYPAVSPAKARLRYFFSFIAIVDLIAVLPFYLPVFFPLKLGVLHAMHLLRVFSILMLGRYSAALQTVGSALRRKLPQLVAFSLVASVLLIVTSVLMYDIEYTAQPLAFKNALAGFWWAVGVVTGTSYGSIYPITAAGLFLEGVTAFFGVGFIAVLSAIITTGFVEEAFEPKLQKAPAAELEAFFALYEKGAITKEEYEEKKRRLLAG